MKAHARPGDAHPGAVFRVRVAGWKARPFALVGIIALGTFWTWGFTHLDAGNYVPMLACFAVAIGAITCFGWLSRRFSDVVEIDERCLRKGVDEITWASTTSVSVESYERFGTRFHKITVRNPEKEIRLALTEVAGRFADDGEQALALVRRKQSRSRSRSGSPIVP